MAHRGVHVLYLPVCKNSYHNNFYMSKGVRYYYEGIPDFIQVGDHQFVEHKVVRHWIDLMLCGW